MLITFNKYLFMDFFILDLNEMPQTQKILYILPVFSLNL